MWMYIVYYQDFVEGWVVALETADIFEAVNQFAEYHQMGVAAKIESRLEIVIANDNDNNNEEKET